MFQEHSRLLTNDHVASGVDDYLSTEEIHPNFVNEVQSVRTD